MDSISSDNSGSSRVDNPNEESHRLTTPSESPSGHRPSSSDLEANSDDDHLLNDGCDAEAGFLPILPRLLQKSKKQHYVAATWLLLALHLLRLIHDFISWFTS